MSILNEYYMFLSYIYILLSSHYLFISFLSINMMFLSMNMYATLFFTKILDLNQLLSSYITTNPSLSAHI